MILYRFVLWSLMMEIEENRQYFVNYLFLSWLLILSLMSNSQHTHGWGSILVTLIDVILCLFLSDSLCLLSLQKTNLKSQLYSFCHIPCSLSDETGLPSGIWCLKWHEWLIRKRIKASCHTLKCPQHTLKVLSDYSHPHTHITALVFQDTNKNKIILRNYSFQ